ncbi:unnamed protein product [Camellia sinensis]
MINRKVVVEEEEEEEEEESEFQYSNWDLIEIRTMPRKVNCGIDYDEDYDYDSDVQEISEGPETKQENITLGVWCCPICTFDNKRVCLHAIFAGFFVLLWVMLAAMEIRTQLTSILVDGMCKDSGASIMARSLFASLPCLTPNKPKTFQQRNDNFLMEECNSFCKLGPLKFDVPSPYDLVLKGLRLSKVGSKDFYGKG